MKYIIVTGGVMSGLGKGITAASIGRILENRGYSVTAIKIDPYINIDAGTMNPLQHGEVYVLKDGGEVDLDLGHYERFLDVELTSEHNITTGKVYKTVIEKERRGDYLGKTVQIIPHITNEIKENIRSVAKKSKCEICLVEIGGTVGDIESMPFLEAVRQMHAEEKESDTVFIHVTLVPSDTMGEQKTKPTQHSVKALRELGLQPDAIVGRCKEPLTLGTKQKIALFCDVPPEAVISAHNADDIYRVPLMLEKEGLDDYLSRKLDIKPKESRQEWYEMIRRLDAIDKEVTAAIVGKYGIEDVYLSIKEALRHAGVELGCSVSILWIDSEALEEDPESLRCLEKAHGILVPGGFGARGTEGKIRSIQYSRENNIPYLGLCFGFQLAVIEYARNMLGLKDANSSELSDTKNAVIDLLPEQGAVKIKGGTMRLGNHTITIKEDTLAHKIYGAKKIVERHRHRFEVNPDFIPKLEEKGIVFSGYDDYRMEITELPEHRFFIGTQFHPEFKSVPGRPSPVFKAFVKAMIERGANAKKSCG